MTAVAMSLPLVHYGARAVMCTVACGKRLHEIWLSEMRTLVTCGSCLRTHVYRKGKVPGLYVPGWWKP